MGCVLRMILLEEDSSGMAVSLYILSFVLSAPLFDLFVPLFVLFGSLSGLFEALSVCVNPDSRLLPKVNIEAELPLEIEGDFCTLFMLF